MNWNYHTVFLQKYIPLFRAGGGQGVPMPPAENLPTNVTMSLSIVKPNRTYNLVNHNVLFCMGRP